MTATVGAPLLVACGGGSGTDVEGEAGRDAPTASGQDGSSGAGDTSTTANDASGGGDSTIGGNDGSTGSEDSGGGGGDSSMGSEDSSTEEKDSGSNSHDSGAHDSGAGTDSGSGVDAGGTVDAGPADAGAPDTGPVLYPVNVAVSGLDSGDDVVLQDNNGDTLTVIGNGTIPFATSLASGRGYAVTVLMQPMNPPQFCTVGSGSGTVNGAPPPGITLSCVDTFAIGGTISGLANGDTVVLTDNGGDALSVTASGTGTDPFTFVTRVSSGRLTWSQCRRRRTRRCRSCAR